MRRRVTRVAPILMGIGLLTLGVSPLIAQADDTQSNLDVLGVGHPAPPPESTGTNGAVVAGPQAATANPQAAMTVSSCSEQDLKAAIASVAATGGTVNLKPGCTYTLTDATPPNDDNGLPVITNAVTINGLNSTITRAQTAANFRFFEIDGPGGSLTLNNVTLSNGHASSSLGNGRGGAIWLKGSGPTLTLSTTTLTDNIADSYGGAIDNDNGTVIAKNLSNLNNNRSNAGGGAIFVSPFGGSGKATFTGSIITQNHAGALGGGVAAAVGTTVTLNQTQVTKNDVTGSTPLGGGIAQAGTIALNNTVVNNNTVTGTNAQGGGLYNIAGTVTINGGFGSGNTVNGTNARGGGIFNTSSGNVTLTNTPITNNKALGGGATGGGIFNSSGTVTLVGSPVISNQPNNCGNPSTVPGCK